MAKAAINKTLKLNASGILAIADDGVYIENGDTGELVNFKDLLSEFADKSVKVSVTYDYDCGTDTEEE